MALELELQESTKTLLMITFFQEYTEQLLCSYFPGIHRNLFNIHRNTLVFIFFQKYNQESELVQGYLGLFVIA